MSLHLQKKHLVWMGSIALLSIIIALASWLWLSSHHDKKDQFTSEKKRLSEIFTTLDTAYWRNKEKNLSLSYQAINLSIKINDSNALAQALYYKAKVLYEFEQSDSAFSIFKQLLAKSDKYKNDTLKAKVETGIGNYYIDRENYYLAIQYYSDALKLAQQINNEKLISSSNNGLGIIYLYLKEYDKAIRCMNKSVVINKKHHEKRHEAVTYMNIGNCYFEQKKYNLANASYQKALAIIERLDDKKMICKVYLNLGLLNTNLKNYKIALQYLKKATEHAAQIDDKRIYAMILQNLGTLYANQKDLKTAEGYFKKSLLLFLQINHKSGEMKANLGLADLNREMQHWQKAYQYHLRFVEFKDSILNSEIQKKISSYQYEIELQKKQYEKELLQKRYDTQKRNNLILVISTMSAIIIVLLIRKNAKKSTKVQKMENAHLQEKVRMTERIRDLEESKHQLEMEAKKKEMVSFSLQLTTKNDLLDKISKLSEKCYNENILNRSYFNELTKIIEAGLNMDKEWGQFKILFENVHHDFFNKLKNRCPDLTEHELRFCTYIKMNLTTKEIARLLNINPTTVRVFRCRLKSKLALDSQLNVEDFLRSI